MQCILVKFTSNNVRDRPPTADDAATVTLLLPHEDDDDDDEHVTQHDVPDDDSGAVSVSLQTVLPELASLGLPAESPTSIWICRGHAKEEKARSTTCGRSGWIRSLPALFRKRQKSGLCLVVDLKAEVRKPWCGNVLRTFTKVAHVF